MRLSPIDPDRSDSSRKTLVRIQSWAVSPREDTFFAWSTQLACLAKRMGKVVAITFCCVSFRQLPDRALLARSLLACHTTPDNSPFARENDTGGHLLCFLTGTDMRGSWVVQSVSISTSLAIVRLLVGDGRSNRSLGDILFWPFCDVARELPALERYRWLCQLDVDSTPWRSLSHPPSKFTAAVL